MMRCIVRKLGYDYENAHKLGMYDVINARKNKEFWFKSLDEYIAIPDKYDELEKNIKN